jgi:hypothetical protein
VAAAQQDLSPASEDFLTSHRSHGSHASNSLFSIAKDKLRRSLLSDNTKGMIKPLKKTVKIERPQREKVRREEALKRVKAFPKRKEKLIAAIREGSH